MYTLLSKLVCAVLFANFFLAVLFCTEGEVMAQSLPGSHRPDLPDASGTTALAEHAYLCNPALFAGIDSAVAAAVVTPSRFSMPGLACSDLLAGWPAGNLAYGCALGGTGTALYNELSAMGFFAIEPTQDFAAGIALALLRLGIRDTPAQTILHVHAGIRLRFSDNTTAGMALINSTGSGFGTDSPVDQAALLSVGTLLTKEVAASAGVLVRPGSPSSFLLATSYSALPTVRMRLGVQTFPRSAEGGLAWSFDTFTITGTAHYHDALGFSQTIGCVYRW